MPFDDPARRQNDGRASPLSRRRWLKYVGLAGAVGLAGCSGNDGSNTDTEGRGDTAAPTSTPVATTVEGFGAETPSETATETGASTETPEPLPAVDGTYKLGYGSTVTTLNPLYNTEDGAARFISLALDGAYDFKPGQIQFPRLFELSSDDNRVWTAKLRENLRWSDPYGEVTAEDFVYLVKKVHQTDWAGTAASSDWYRTKESGGKPQPIPVEKTGKYSFEIQLFNSDPLFPKKPVTWGMRVVPKDLVKPYVENEDAKGLEKDEELLNLEFTGNLGAYNLEKWQRQKKLTFTRNDEYYLREADDVKHAFSNAPYFEGFEAQIIKEPAARVGALEAGDVDEVALDPTQAVNLEDNDGLYLNVSPQPYCRPLFYNMRANGWKPFRRQGVRQALGCAINKPKYVKGVQRDYGTPQYTWQPRWSPWYDAEKVVKYGKGDLYGPQATRDRMKEALSDTDYGYDNSGNLLDPQGNQVELKMMYQSGQSIEKQTAQYVKQEFMKNAGIKVSINPIGGLKFVQDYWRQQKPENPGELAWHNSNPNNYGPRDEVTSKKSWDMGLIYRLNTYPMTPTSSSTFFKKKGLFNAVGYYPSYDLASLFQRAGDADSKQKQKQLLAEIFGKISKDQPMGMLSLRTEIIGYRNPVTGPQEEFFNGWDSETWYRKPESESN